MPETFEVFSAKGKSFDYTALDEAMDKAMAAYESIGKNGFNKNDLDVLWAAVAVWEKELNELFTEDSKARISKEIAKCTKLTSLQNKGTKLSADQVAELQRLL